MKNQQEKEVQQDFKFRQLEDSIIYCLKNNKADYACFNKYCEKNNVFVCSSKKCQCRGEHKMCCYLEVDSFVNKIMQKSITLRPIEQMICQKIEKTIDQLSKIRDQVSLMLKQNFQHAGLSKDEIKLVQGIKSGKVDEINGMFLWNILIQQNDQKISQQIESFENKIKLIWEDLDKYISQGSRKICSEIEQTKNRLLNKGVSNESLFKDSQVLKSLQHKQKIVNFFQTSQIKKSTLLYRASQNEFLVSKFHDKCDNIPNTIFVLQNQYGKILGGFTNVVWNKNLSNISSDNEYKTFIFSATTNQKFKLVSKKLAIYNYPSYGPTFGNFVLYTCDKSNSNKKSYFQVKPDNFINQNYTQNTAQTHLKLSGNPNNDSYFSIKQWQVWSIEFQN